MRELTVLKIFKDKRVGIISSLISGCFVLIVAIIQIIPQFFESEKTPTINNNADGVQNVILGDGQIYQTSIRDLENYRAIGKSEGYEIGYIDGVKSIIYKNKEYIIPLEVIEQMFPMVNGLNYSERQKLAKSTCSMGSLTARDICHFDVMKTGKKGRPSHKSPRYTKITEETDVRTEEQKQKGYGQLSIVVKRYGAVAPKSNGDISTEERVLKNSDPWYLACSRQKGCRLLDITNLSVQLKTINANESVIKGAQVKKGEWFADYRLRMTGLFLNGDIVSLSPTLIDSLINKGVLGESKNI